MRDLPECENMMNLREIAKQYNRYIPDDVKLVERNGRIWLLHPRMRFDPITLAIIAVGVGTAVKVSGTLAAGKQAEKIGKARAEIDRRNAEQVRKASVEKARVKGEKGRRLRATQKSLAAAGGIRINVGSPLVIETETKDIFAKDIGFILESGRAESDFFRSRAALEIATGKAAKKKSRFDALSQGLLGVGKIASLGAGAGLFSGTPSTTGGRGTADFSETGTTLARLP